MENKWHLCDAFKAVSYDQDKIKPPAETVAEVKKKLAALDMKIFEETIRIDSGRLDIPVFFSICGPDAVNLTGTNKQMGKGATPDQAEASAIMELVERFSFYAFLNNDKNLKLATITELGNRAMEPEMIAGSVGDTSGDAGPALDFLSKIPLRWAHGFNLTRNVPVLVPIDWFFAINEFNGTSAGNCLEEALCQGICEIVERHVSAVVCQDKPDIPGIRPESATQPVVCRLLEKYKKNRIKIYVSDFSLGMGIPTVGVMAWDPATFPARSEIVWTAGTAPDPQKAFSRALTETAQLAGDFETKSNYVASGLPKPRSFDEFPFIIHPGSMVDISDLPDISDQNIRIEVINCIERLKAKDMEIISINTTHPELNIPALYTMIPGARFRERARAGSVGMFTAKLILDQYGPARAIDMLHDMERILPDKYYIHFYIGQALYESERPDEAVASFEKSLSLDPPDEDAAAVYSFLGAALNCSGKFPDAIKALEKGAELDPERTDIYNQLGFAYFKQKKHEKAIDAFKNVIRINPSSAIDYANIGTNFRELGDIENAIFYYHTAIQIDPGIEFAWTNLQQLTKRK